MSNDFSGTRRVAVVTGGNRGIGFAVCRELATRGLQIVLTSRSIEDGLEAQLRLSSEGLEVSTHPLDVTQPASIQSLCTFLRETFPRVDVLVNNAGVMLDIVTENGQTRVGGAFEISLEAIRLSIEINSLGPFELIRKLAPGMIKNRYGRIVNVSSGLGQVSTAGALWPGYRISKIALNGITKIFADELKNTNVLVNAASPGWVKTRMGGAHATMTPEQGADTIAWLATLPDGGPTGGFFENRKEIPW